MRAVRTSIYRDLACIAAALGTGGRAGSVPVLNTDAWLSVACTRWIGALRSSAWLAWTCRIQSGETSVRGRGGGRRDRPDQHRVRQHFGFSSTVRVGRERLFRRTPESARHRRRLGAARVGAGLERQPEFGEAAVVGPVRGGPAVYKTARGLHVHCRKTTRVYDLEPNRQLPRPSKAPAEVVAPAKRDYR